MSTNDKIIDLHQQGVSQRRISEQLGVSRHQVRSAISGAKPGNEASAYDVARAVAGQRSRTSVDMSVSRRSILSHGIGLVLNDSDAHADYDFQWLDAGAIDRLGPTRLLEILTISSPEVSRAMWDFLRMCVPGWEVVVTDSRTGKEHEAATEYLRLFRSQIARYHGSEDTLYIKMFSAIALRGSLLTEVYFEDDGRTAVDIAVPDPSTIRFRRRDDPVRGEYWQVGQVQDGKFVALEGETIRYIALDPLPGKPYGRSPMTAALFPALFLLGMFQDLRRVIANQGYPRIDISVDVETIQGMLKEAMGRDAPEAEVVSLLNRITEQVADTINDLKPGDYYVHSSLVSVNPAVGTMGAEALGNVDSIIDSLERFAVKALKTMPLLQGITENTSEANANRQWEIHARGINTVQHLVENDIEDHYRLVLQAAGFDVDVTFRFAELRAAEELRDAQTLRQKAETAIMLEKAGYMTADEAAIHAVGHGIPNEVAEDRVPLLNQSLDGSGSADVGTQIDGNEHVALSASSYVRDPASYTGPLPDVPDEVKVTAFDAIIASAEFDQIESAYAGLLDAEPV